MLLFGMSAIQSADITEDTMSAPPTDLIDQNAEAQSPREYIWAQMAADEG